jgi:transposase
MAAVQTRASIAAQGDFYLCPLSALQASPEQVSQEVETQRAQGARLIEVCRLDEQGMHTCSAQGYETIHRVTAQVDGQTHTWQERRLLVQSRAATQAAQASLHERLQKAEQALQEHVHERRVRAYRGRLSGVRRDLTFTLTSSREETAIGKAMNQLGWRVYASNHVREQLTLEQAVEASRDEYLVERNFSRLKGRPLSLVPLYGQRDDHRIGLVRLLTRALRVLTLLEGVVRQRLGAQTEELAGLFAGNPTRRTAQPTAERLLEAFREVTLTVVSAPGFAQRHVTPLSPLQQQILTLLGFSPAVYLRLVDDS